MAEVHRESEVSALGLHPRGEGDSLIRWADQALLVNRAVECLQGDGERLVARLGFRVFADQGERIREPAGRCRSIRLTGVRAAEKGEDAGAQLVRLVYGILALINGFLAFGFIRGVQVELCLLYTSPSPRDRS